jgi:Carbohydrate family 9 binding domain-like
MIRKILCLSFLVLSTSLVAANLIKNSEVNDKIGNEFRRTGSSATSMLSVEIEDLTWNKCAKLSIKKYYVTKDGKKKVNFGVIIGGEKKKAGFPTKADINYEFTLELKGTVPFAGIRAFQWNGPGYYKDRKNLKTSIKRVKVQKDWTVYKGTFKTTKGAKRAALYIQVWDESNKAGKIKTKKTDILLIDNIIIKEKVKKSLAAGQVKKVIIAKKKAIKALRASSTPVIDGKLDDSVWKNASLVKSFVDYKTGQVVEADTDTEVKVLSDEENIYLAIKCLEPNISKLQAKIDSDGSKNVWKDDAVEIFFSPVTPDRVLSQFVVSAGGGRWMNFGDRYKEWDAKVSKTSDSWTLEVKIPFKTLGWKTAAKSGDMVKFNVCRQRKAAKKYSCWSPVRANFHDQSNYGLLVVNSFNSNLKQEIADLKSELADLDDNDGKKKVLSELGKISSQTAGQVSADAFSSMYAKLQGIKAQLKFLKTGNLKFTVAMVSPTSNLAIPFEPDEAFEPQDKFELRAAINEYKAMPLAITNMTDKTAAYRVIIYSGVDNGISISGLSGFPKNKIVMREAIRVKDSETAKHGMMFDPLPLMNQAYTITVPAKQSSLVWVTFNCTDVKPGTYKGKVRVIPFSEPAKYVLKGGWKYIGPLQDVPVSLEVMPIELPKTPSRPFWFMRLAATESFFKSMIEHGNRVFQLSPWSFKFKFNKDGSIKNYDLPKIEKIIRQHLTWAKKYNVKIDFLIGFSAYRVFKKVHAKQFKYGSPEWKNAWINWLRGVARTMKKCGADPRKCVVETWDEPHLKDVDIVLLSSKLAKKANTGMQMQITFGATQHKISFLKKLIDYVDVWCPWGSFFVDDEYKNFFISVGKKPGKKLWFYYCSTNLREPLYRYYRRHAWMGLNYKTDVIGMFALINGPGGYYGANSFKASGTGGALVYRSFDQCIPSVRYECLRIGMTDIEYMAKLKKLSDKVAKSGTSALVSEARKLLTEGTYEVAVSQAHDSEAADRVRNKAIELILKLQK